MPEDQCLSFGPYRLSPHSAQLWRGTRAVRLTRPAWRVLRHLVERAGELVTKEELFGAVWPETAVSDAALTRCIHELRRVFQDDARQSRYIETVHRLGFRFIARMHSPRGRRRRPLSETPHEVPPCLPHFVGRESEMARLEALFAKAERGGRQVAFVTGEPGIGKTTAVEAFVARVARTGDVWVARGQCVETYGAGEGYLPVLEALERLCRLAGGARLPELLRQHAPLWLAQLPALVEPAERAVLERRLTGITSERMLREFVHLVEALTADDTLVLWLEDLHWSDVSTLGLLAYVARRRERARLMVIGTYRPAEVLVQQHPLGTLKQELHVHGWCEEVPLDFLPEAAVGEYLALRFAGPGLPPALGRVLYRSTEGNPLFLVKAVDELVARGVITREDGGWSLRGTVHSVEIPISLRHFIEQQVDRLSSQEQQVLEAASVAGVEFSAAAVAAGIDSAGEDVEKRCEDLARRGQFLRVRGTAEWPDGTLATRFGFVHALYHNVLYERVAAGRCMALHRRIGERQEAAYGPRAGEIAAELAVHFERGRDHLRAVQYLRQAGEHAMRRGANQEALRDVQRGLELLASLPESPERRQAELHLQLVLGYALMMTRGFPHPEAAHAYVRARELSQHADDPRGLSRALVGLWIFHQARAEHEEGRKLGLELLQLAQRTGRSRIFLVAHQALAHSLYFTGEFIAGREHCEQGVRLAAAHPPIAASDPGVICGALAGLVLWSLGHRDQGQQRSREALVLAESLANPHSLAIGLWYSAAFHLFCRDVPVTLARAEAAVALSAEHDFPAWRSTGEIWLGWALTKQGQCREGIAGMEQGLAAWRETGARVWGPFALGLLAEAYGEIDQDALGLRLLAEAFREMDTTQDRFCAAELHRLKGELTLKSIARDSDPTVALPRFTSSPRAAEAEACFHRAIAIARRQSAKSWELRAVMSLSRLWRRQGRRCDAHRLLAETYGWFTEGFDTADLLEAQALLGELQGSDG